jgi:hypothetical protein
MRAHTIATTSRPRRMARHVVVALALGISGLAIPGSASGSPVDALVDGWAPMYTASGSSDSSQAVGGTDDSLVSSITPPAGEQGPPSGSGDSSLNGQPTFVSDSPPATADGFDWSSAAVGAGAVLALLALGGAALLTARSR